MSILDWFEDKQKKNGTSEKLNIPGDVWEKCPKCSEVLFLKDLENNNRVCTSCKFHFRISAQERIQFIFDKNTFVEEDDNLISFDSLKFTDVESYQTRIDKAIKKTKKNDAVIIGQALLKGIPVQIACMDFFFMGGSMGAVVGEKVTRSIEYAIEKKIPFVSFSASGGARMQEGINSLMQLAKTSAAVSRLSEAKIPFISVLTDPTTGGTSASFAMLGDIHIAEPGALISFAGPRVIEQTIRQKLPKGAQRAEFLLKHGIVDMVVDRNNLRITLHKVLQLLYPQEKIIQKKK